jgi:hypothetical protein
MMPGQHTTQNLNPASTAWPDTYLAKLAAACVQLDAAILVLALDLSL